MSLLEQQALGAGLVNSEQIMAYSDSLATGLSSDRIAHGLTSAWSIHSPVQATETLNWLMESGDRSIFDIVYREYASKDANLRAAGIDDALAHSDLFSDEEARATANAKAQRMLANIDETFRLLKDPVNGPYLPEHYTRGILAWDLGRLITLARLCSDFGYIDSAERDRIFAFVGSQVISNYPSWSIFARSYILGRAAWGGKAVTLDGIIGIASDALKEKRSPWVLSPCNCPGTAECGWR
ncbi:DUF1266 domain-containing protein [Rhodococcus sp. OK302]|uniref:DUF1266 domain-containing protein n=1 Tax=Rhodococcus sp. OK302 TaxID=1882769 RepID=UPI000B93B68A|nr:DUF1266 domain-containing protein [Rhodococcus sp. OK302]